MSSSVQKIVKITNLVTRILGCNPGMMTLDGTNTYVVGNGPKRILIDTGEPSKSEYIKLLTNYLIDEEVDLEHIIITHWHKDHIGGVEDIFKKITNEPKVWKYPRTDAENSPTWGKISLGYLFDGQQFSTQGATLKVVSTPGHTTDHIVLKLFEENAIFSGDCILGGSTAVFEDLYDYMKSLKKILDMKPSVIYPGHGYTINEPCGEIQKYIDHRMKRESQIIDLLKKSKKEMTVSNIVSVLYADIPKRLHLAAGNNVTQHLKKLEKEGIVIFNEDNHSWEICDKED
ncbi:endoribonuclease LACTB2 isoform X2 [Cimex lectularius]|uniref:Beta-lactamase-like protein 2 homolog n=1 Tax=Cimex lectularius TaxID=79782 RepID=A0A8I6RQS5_CIMLE|nr:endoribonuclease LACTB2 isoform X2 [Cimex lectularius]